MRNWLVALAALAVATLAACSQAPTVVVYVSHDQVFSEPILKDFERDTGIKVCAIYDTEESKSTGAMNRLAAASVVIARDRAAQLGALAGVLATAVAIFPTLNPTIWPLIWNNHPVFFVTDQLKLLVAIPFLAWVIRKASPELSKKRIDIRQAATRL
jgi:hypothetical protein